MSKYLYGAAVQGIQDFIFKTNKLQEIVGASELVEQVCTSKFAEILGKKQEDLAMDSNAIVNAAGNIKYIFDDYGSCQEVVRLFPKQIVEHAPGITISQAVVKYGEVSLEDNEENGGIPEAKDFENAVMKLEEKLRSQRNKPMRSPTIGLMGIERSRQTGMPAIVTDKKEEHIDAATYRKLFDDEKEGILQRNSVEVLLVKMLTRRGYHLTLRKSLAKMTGLLSSMLMAMAWDRSCSISAQSKASSKYFPKI